MIQDSTAVFREALPSVAAAQNFVPTLCAITTWLNMTQSNGHPEVILLLLYHVNCCVALVFPLSAKLLGLLLQQVNTFQLIMTTNGTVSFVVFLYRHIQWGSGIAGFDAADQERFFMLPGSLTTTHDFPAGGNIQVPGAYFFRVDLRRISFPPFG